MRLTEARARLIAQEQELHQLRREVGTARLTIASMHATEAALRKACADQLAELNRLRPQATNGLDALARYDAARALSPEVYDDVE
jgi:septal ring factor EnvC (AmiA/AmiB activator)